MNQFAKKIFVFSISLAIFLITSDIALAQRGNLGWSPPENISNTTTESTSPSLAADPSGVVHLVWVEPENEGGSVIYYTRREDSQWSTPIDIIYSEGTITSASITSDTQGNLHLLWADNGTFYSHVYAPLAGSALNWESPQELLPPANFLTTPDLAIGPDDQLHIVYAIQVGKESGVYYLHSIDGGNNWEDPRLVYQNSSATRHINQPTITISPNGKMHLVWVEANYPETFPPLGIRYTNSLDGILWNEPTRLAEGPYSDPEISTRGNNEVHVVWSGTATDRFKFHRWSADGGQNWYDAWRNTDLGGLQGSPGLAVDGSQVLHWLPVGTIFSDQHGDNLYHTQLKQGTWSPGQVVLVSQDVKNNPSNVSAVVSKGNKLHVALMYPIPSSENPQGYQMEIYYLFRSLDAIELPRKELPLLTRIATPEQDSLIIPSNTAEDKKVSLQLNTATQSIVSQKTVLVIALVPSILVIGVIIIFSILTKRNR